MTEDEIVRWHHQLNGHVAAAAAKVCQSCPTLCDPIDGSQPGSSIHGIFQTRVLEWGAIAFSVRIVADAAAAVKLLNPV